MTQTNPHVATLFQLIQEEKKQNKLRAHTYENLNELENMLPGLNGAEALRTLYKEKLTTTANDSLIDRFTVAAITAAKALCIPFELSQFDSETIHSAVDNFKSLVDFAGDQAKELVDDGVKQGREDDEPEEDESLDEVTVPGLSTDWEDVDGLPEEALVKQEVENYYSERCIFPVFYPGWCPPTTGSVFFKPASAASLLEASQTSQESNTREQDPPASLRSSSATSKSSCASQCGPSLTFFSRNQVQACSRVHRCPSAFEQRGRQDRSQYPLPTRHPQRRRDLYQERNYDRE